jgi:carboxymethylenebutenolidase
MTELQQYLAEEIAEDHADGIITRREAMRRLGLLGLGATPHQGCWPPSRALPMHTGSGRAKVAPTKEGSPNGRWCPPSRSPFQGRTAPSSRPGRLQ